MSPYPQEEDDSKTHDELEAIVEHLIAFLTAGGPHEPGAGPQLLIRLSPRDLRDDRRILELLAALAREVDSVVKADSEPPLAPGRIDPMAAERTVTPAVEAEFGPALAAQNAKADEAREAGAPSCASAAERLAVRTAAKDAISAFNLLATELCRYCAARLRDGCTWWESNLPQPLKGVLESAASGAGVAAVTGAPVAGVLTAIVVVALCRHPGRSGSGHK